MTTRPENPRPDYVVLLVRSISHAMKGESALTKAGVPHKLVPVPRSLSSQCGICIRVAPGDREAAETTLTTAGIEIVATHELHDRRSCTSHQTSDTSQSREPTGE
jgi:hypothetical protein